MTTKVNGVNLTAACAKALIVIGSSPASLDQFDPRVPRTLGKNGLAEVAGDKLRITPEGLAILKAHTGKETTPAPVETKPAKRGDKRLGKKTKPARRESPPPTGKVDIRELRAQIVARYEADLAACDRLEEIARAVSA